MSKSVVGQPIFGTYFQPENQVTYALLKIFECDRENGEMISEFLRLCGGEKLPENTISIETQYTGKDTKGSIPDGHLSCRYSFDIFVESKLTEYKPTDEKQLQNHLKVIEGDCGKKLIYITVDGQRPNKLPSHVLWTNWTKLMNFLADYRQDRDGKILNYLIDQFELLLNEKGLCDDYENRVIIVGGAVAEPIALDYEFYYCQVNRHFRNAKYMAFYHSGQIAHLFEIIDGPVVADIQERDDINPDYFKKVEPNYKPESRTFFKLKRMHDFAEPIQNNIVDKNGNPWPFTIGTSYTTYQQIMSAKNTSELR